MFGQAGAVDGLSGCGEPQKGRRESSEMEGPKDTLKKRNPSPQSDGSRKTPPLLGCQDHAHKDLIQGRTFSFLGDESKHGARFPSLENSQPKWQKDSPRMCACVGG